MAAEDSFPERPRQRRRVLAGLLLIAGLVALSALIFFLDDLRTASDERYRIYAIVPGATGLTVGSPVSVSGSEVGTVTSIAMSETGDTRGLVAVELELPVDIMPQVREDSRVRFRTANVMSERVIDIDAGTAAAPALPSGDTLRLFAPALTGKQLSERATTVRREMDSVLVELRTLSPLLRVQLVRTGTALARLGATMNDASSIRIDLEANPGYALLRDPSFATSLRNTRTQAAAVSALFDDRTATVAGVQTAVAQLSASADSLRVLLATAAEALDDPNGNFARFQHDGAITRAIAAARAELDSLIADVRRNPLRYVF